MAEPPLPLPHPRLVSCPSPGPVCLASSRPVCPGASLLFALCANLISSYYGAEILQFPQMPKTRAGLVSRASTASSVYLCPEMENTCKQPQTQLLLDEVFIGRVAQPHLELPHLEVLRLNRKSLKPNFDLPCLPRCLQSAILNLNCL